MLKQKNEEVKDIVKEEVSKEVVKENPKVKQIKKNVRKIVDRNMEVIIMNNTNGGFIYICPKTQNRYEMSGFGDIDYITVNELLTMKNSHRAILEKFWILLVDVVSDEVELEDVLKYLGLDKLYNDILKPDEVDNFIIKSTDDNFKNALSKMNKNLAERVIERAVMLFKEKKFNQFSKIQYMQNLLKNEYLFQLEEESEK